jgi:hypothetical protein
MACIATYGFSTMANEIPCFQFHQHNLIAICIYVLVFLL